MTNANLYFEIQGISGHDYIRVGVNGLKFPSANGDWDKNILNSVVDFNIGIFSGKLEADLMTTDFKTFKQELDNLYKNLKGTAIFEGSEGNLTIQIEGDGIGHLTAKCFITDSFPDGNEMKGELGFDQTQIPRIITQLEKITFEFPPTGIMKIEN